MVEWELANDATNSGLEGGQRSWTAKKQFAFMWSKKKTKKEELEFWEEVPALACTKPLVQEKAQKLLHVSIPNGCGRRRWRRRRRHEKLLHVSIPNGCERRRWRRRRRHVLKRMRGGGK